MCYREDQPVSLEEALRPNPKLAVGKVFWIEGLPANADNWVSREFERNLRSSPMIGCKRGAEIEKGDRLVMGAGTSYWPSDFTGTQQRNGLTGRMTTGRWGGAHHAMFLFDDELYEVTDSSIDRV